MTGYILAAFAGLLLAVTITVWMDTARIDKLTVRLDALEARP